MLDQLNFEDLSGTYSVTDITLSMVLSLLLTAAYYRWGKWRNIRLLR